MGRRVYGIRTGLYRRETFYWSDRDFQNGKFFEQANRAMNLEYQLDGLIRWAERLLRRYGVVPLKRKPKKLFRPGYTLGGQAKHYFWVPEQRPPWVKVRNAPKKAPPELVQAWWENTIQRAEHLLGCIWMVRLAVAAGKPDLAALRAINLGIAKEQLHLSFVEPRALVGMKVLEGATRKNGESPELSRQRGERNQRFKEEANRLRAQGKSDRSIASILVRHPLNQCPWGKSLKAEAIRKIIGN